MEAVHLKRTDALAIVDVQNDFFPRGKLAVRGGDKIVPALNHVIGLFNDRGLPIYATRYWHPPEHGSFTQQGGAWPPHCIADSTGAAFPSTLGLPSTSIVISRVTSAAQRACSAFDGTGLSGRLRAQHVERLFVGGLATDHAVLDTVRDALKQDFKVVLLLDAIKAVNAADGKAAINQMIRLGAQPFRIADIERANQGQYVQSVFVY